MTAFLRRSPLAAPSRFRLYIDSLSQRGQQQQGQRALQYRALPTAPADVRATHKGTPNPAVVLSGAGLVVVVVWQMAVWQMVPSGCVMCVVWLLI